MDEITLPVIDDEPRLFEETGIEARVAALIAPVLKPMGYRLVRVRFSGLNGATLQIMTERSDGTLTIDDCETVSRTVSPLLDVEDIIAQKYYLEVSSPGIDRPLVRKSDFSTWENHLAKIETINAVDGRRKFRGIIQNTDETGFTLRSEKAAYGEESAVTIEFNNISEARLVLTDELINAALAKDKALRHQREREQPTLENGFESHNKI